MTDDKNSLEQKLEELKSSFDCAFQEAILPPTGDFLHLLMVRVATATFALDVAELAGVVPAPKIVPIPAQAHGLLGLAGIKARLVPVYSLACLVGAKDVGAARWIALCGHDDRIGLAFTELERVHIVPRSAVRPVAAGAPPHAAALIASDPSPICLLAFPR